MFIHVLVLYGKSFLFVHIEKKTFARTDVKKQQFYIFVLKTSDDDSTEFLSGGCCTVTKV